MSPQFWFCKYWVGNMSSIDGQIMETWIWVAVLRQTSGFSVGSWFHYDFVTEIWFPPERLKSTDSACKERRSLIPLQPLPSYFPVKISAKFISNCKHVSTRCDGRAGVQRVAVGSCLQLYAACPGSDAEPSLESPPSLGTNSGIWAV